MKHTSSFNVLGDVLKTLRFHGSIFFVSKLAAPWGMSLDHMEKPRFHIAFDGDFCIGTESHSEGKKTINVQHMDIVMLPHGNMHWIADQPGRNLIPSDQASEACELATPFFQAGEITNHLLCGLVHYDQDIVHPIINTLPSVLHFSDLKIDDPAWMTVELIHTEIQRSHTYKTSIIDRLTEVLFLQLLQQYTDGEESSGFFAALGNKQIHRVLELIHSKPHHKWKISELCQQIGMSPATLNRHFNQTIGIPPMEYLSNWRMIKAHQLVKYSNYSLSDIAEIVGFSTAKTLSKAFLNSFGYSPNELRKLQTKPDK